MSSKTPLRLVFHAAVTVTYFCALVAFQKLPPMPHNRVQDHYAGRWKYLTYWNLVCHFLFFAFSCIIDLMKPPSSYYYKFIKLRDRFYAGIVLPYGMFVVAVFWILYGIDRELIFPKVLDAVFPVWLNHVSHTMILPVLLIETYILRHRHPRRKDGITITAAFGLVYFAWVLYLALAKDIWPYPILILLNWTQRIVFFGVGLFFLSLLYIVGEAINKLCWGDGIVLKSK